MQAPQNDQGPTEETLTDAAERPPRVRPDVVSAHVFVVLECARLRSGGARHSLAGVDRVVIGRGRSRSSERLFSDGELTLRVRVPDRRMSSRHATIVRDGFAFFLEDCGSRNGTLVNGRPVVAGMPLVDGDIVQAGETVLLFAAAVETPVDSPADFDSAVHGLGAVLSTLDASLARRIAGLGRIAKSALPVLILGETGTGKELVARAVHTLSERTGAFVAVNCGALPATLLEAQLFGHIRGAFSGAVSDAPGLLRTAAGGTLFLDEIGDLPPQSQAALLRALQEQEVTPVGGVRPIPIDLRVVSATHRTLSELVARGEFRSDLYARLAGFTFAIPPLRERRADVGAILSGLDANGPSKCTPEVGRALVRCDWRLNVRELLHAVEAARAVAEGDTVDLANLPPEIAQAASAAPLGADPLQTKLIACLARHRGNVSGVARELGTARMQVQRWMQRFRIDPRSFRRQ